MLKSINPTKHTLTNDKLIPSIIHIHFFNIQTIKHAIKKAKHHLTHKTSIQISLNEQCLYSSVTNNLSITDL